MKLTEIEERIKETMRAKATAIGGQQIKSIIAGLDARLNSLKLIKSELIRENQKVYECAEYKMTEEQEILFLNGMAEARKGNIKDYSNNGRPELAEAENQELLIIQEFLPKMPTEEEIKEFISTTIDEYAASQAEGYALSMRDMGKIKSLVNATYPTITGNVIKDVLTSKF
jgi:hypothetical protein